MLRGVERGVEHRLVLHRARGLDPTGRRHDDRRPGVIDSGGEFVRGETPEHHGMHGTDPRARQHRDDGLGNHGHVHHDTVALAHAQTLEHPREPRCLVEQFGVGVGALRTGHRGVVDQCGLIGASVGDVAVQRVRARIEFGVGEPPVVRRVGVVEDPARLANPGHVAGGVGPERLRVGDACLEELPVPSNFGTAHYRSTFRKICAVGHLAFLIARAATSTIGARLNVSTPDARSMGSLDPTRRPKVPTRRAPHS